MWNVKYWAITGCSTVKTTQEFRRLGIPLVVIFTLSAHKPGHIMICVPMSKTFGHPWQKFACECNDHIIARCGCGCMWHEPYLRVTVRGYSRCNAAGSLLQSLVNTDRQCSLRRYLREMEDSNLDWDTDYFHWGFRGFLCPFSHIRRESTAKYVTIASFHIPYNSPSSYPAPFTVSELLRASLNK